LPEVTRTVLPLPKGSALVQSAALPQTLVRLRDARIGRIAASQLTEHAFSLSTCRSRHDIVERWPTPDRGSQRVANVNAGEVAQTTVRQPDDLSAVGQVASHGGRGRRSDVGGGLIGIPRLKSPEDQLQVIASHRM
jgi:hypothetical protein